MISAIVNALVVVVGSLIGCFFRKRLSERYAKTVTGALGLCVLVIGVSGALETANMIVVIVCVALGALIGTWIDIERRLDYLGNAVQKRFASGERNADFSKGFVTASLMFCVGAMAIVGSMDSGLRGDHSTIYAKSVLDFISSIFFAGTYGLGVAVSAVSVLVYQGAIVLLSGIVEPLLTAAVITEMSAVGGVLIIGVALNMLRKEHIAVGNMLPAIFLPLIIVPFL
ncbi:MAG: DUF554 domain-containing protein [Clostridia bacterium]|nr:DUF554 domain-containing protein [Clostridia bacterium]